MSDESVAAATAEEIFRFGGFVLSARQRLLSLNGKPTRLGGRAFELLLVLVRHAGEVVPVDELMLTVWGRLKVEEANLRVQIGGLRKVLAMDLHGQRMIETVALKGYSFIAPVSRELASTSTAALVPPLPPAQLPASLTRLVGRDDSMASLLSRLDHHRLVTITGTGGIGKTSLALAAANREATGGRDGVYFVDFSPLRDPALVPGAVASALSIAVLEQDPLAGLLAELRGKRVLLVLDTCEHVIDAVVALVEILLRRLPDLRILATSREALRAEGENLHRLSPLELPAPTMPAAQASRTASVELFMQCVRAGTSRFDLTDDRLSLVIRICRALGGLPLALELAAARVDELGLEAVATRLEGAIDVLSRGRRTALPRHRTLTATLDWSYDLLPSDEQALLRAVSVFRGSFDADAAATIAGHATKTAEDLLSNLFAKSLAAVDFSGEVVLYRLLDMTRTWCAGKLTASGEQDATSRRHANFVEAALHRAEADWTVEDADVWLARHSRLIDDVRHALDWSVSLKGDAALGARLTAMSSSLWFASSLMDEYEVRIRLAMKQVPLDAPVEARLWNMLGHATLHTRGNLSTMKEAFLNEKSIARAAGLIDAELRSYWGLSLCAVMAGNYVEATDTLAPFAALAKPSGDRRAQQTLERMSAISLHFAGDHPNSRRFCESVLADTAGGGRKTDEKGLLFDHAVIARSVLARIHWMEGHADQARASAREGVAIAQTIGHALSLCFILANASIPIAYWCGDVHDADDLVALLSSTAERHSFKTWRAYAESYQLVGRDPTGPARPAFLPGIPDLLLDTVATTDARVASDATLHRAERGLAGWCTPELLRIRAVRLLQDGDENSGAAEALLLRSLNVAREQGALAWELRSATSLAALWLQRKRAEAAFELLGPVHGRFAEGLETDDLIRATALLRGLRPGVDVGRARLRSTSRSNRPQPT